jgi:hypothetical protein
MQAECPTSELWSGCAARLARRLLCGYISRQCSKETLGTGTAACAGYIMAAAEFGEQ